MVPERRLARLQRAAASGLLGVGEWSRSGPRRGRWTDRATRRRRPVARAPSSAWSIAMPQSSRLVTRGNSMALSRAMTSAPGVEAEAPRLPVDRARREPRGLDRRDRPVGPAAAARARRDLGDALARVRARHAPHPALAERQPADGVPDRRDREHALAGRQVDELAGARRAEEAADPARVEPERRSPRAPPPHRRSRRVGRRSPRVSSPMKSSTCGAFFTLP